MTWAPDAARLGTLYGKRIGARAFAVALRDRESRGDCDAVRATAIRFAQAYAAADPDVEHAKSKVHAVGPLIARLVHAYTNEIDWKWQQMGCREGRKLVVLPPGFGRVRRRVRRRR